MVRYRHTMRFWSVTQLLYLYLRFDSLISSIRRGQSGFLNNIWLEDPTRSYAVDFRYYCLWRHTSELDRSTLHLLKANPPLFWKLQHHTSINSTWIHTERMTVWAAIFTWTELKSPSLVGAIALSFLTWQRVHSIRTHSTHLGALSTRSHCWSQVTLFSIPDNPHTFLFRRHAC